MTCDECGALRCMCSKFHMGSSVDNPTKDDFDNLKVKTEDGYVCRNVIETLFM